MTCVQRKFELQVLKCKWEEYKGTRYSDGDSSLVVELWLHRVADDLSGLTFQEWDPSVGTDDTSAPVAILVNSRELRAADFPLVEVRPLQDFRSRFDRILRHFGSVKSYFSKFFEEKKMSWCSDAQRMRRFPCLQDFLSTLTCHLAHTG
jgi:hypothetical protein